MGEGCQDECKGGRDGRAVCPAQVPPAAQGMLLEEVLQNMFFFFLFSSATEYIIMEVLQNIPLYIL